MNLGGLLSGLRNESSNNLIEDNKTILIVAVIALIIFGFGYGRSMFGGPAFEGTINYSEAAGYGGYKPNNPGNSKKKKGKHKRRKHRHDDYNDEFNEEVGAGEAYEKPEMARYPHTEGPFGPMGVPGGMGVSPDIPYGPI